MFSNSEIPQKLGVLLVDDEEFNLKAIKRTMHGQGFDIYCAGNGEEALKVMKEEDVAIVVSDMRMPKMSGYDLFAAIEEKWPDTLKIILTGYADIDDTLNLLSSASIFRYISKPWDDENLLSTIHEAAAVYWGKVMDFYFEKTTVQQNEKLKESNKRLRSSIDKSHHQLMKINEKLKSAYEGEKKLRQERRVAEQESIAKSQFLAMMSHEMRTPLNAIIATNTLLLESNLNSDQKELVQLGLSGGTTLLTLINDILDMGKISAGKLELSEEWFNIVELTEKTCELLSSQTTKKPVDLVVTIEEKAPLEVYGDKNRIQQIIMNLVSNALKFTDEGCVSVEISGAKELSITVTDSGEGMSSEELELVFDEFTQVDSSSTREKGGTGLGLSICKKLADLMKGRVEAYSQKGKGSTFSLIAPLAYRNPISFPRFQNAHILLLSANQALYSAMSKQLRQFNCNITISDQLNDIGSEPVDAVLFDLGSIQPTADELGYLANDTSADPVKIALVDAERYDSNSSSRLDMYDEILHKPLTLRGTISNVVNNIYIEPDYSNLSESQKKTYFALSKKENKKTKENISQTLDSEVLLVEDSLSNQAVVKESLKKMKVDITIANNGKEAVELCRKRRFDIVLMDMAMPVMDGITATRKIKQEKGLNYQTPIIALTANAFSEDKKACRDAGMVDFLHKPIDVNTLRNTISRWSSAKREGDHESIKDIQTSAESKATFPLIEENAFTAETPTNRSVINENVLTQLEKDTSREVLPTIINIFLDETRARLQDMKALLEQENWQDLSGEAHTLKSSAGSFGAMDLSVLARKIEESVKSDKTDMTIELCEKLEPMILATVTELEKYKSAI